MRNLPRPSRVGWTSVSTAVLGALIWFGCADAPQAPVTPDAELTRSAQATSRLQELDLTPALEAQERHGAALMRIPGVVGHGAGVDEDGNPSVVVFTSRPGVSGIPARLDAVPTRVVPSGMFVVLTDETAKHRPAPIGVSIGHPDITAGTLGFRVKNGSGGTFILSNNHVMANSNDATIGDNILQPGPFDGGSDPADKIGTLHDFVPIDFNGGNNVVDAAIASVSASDVLASTPEDEGYGTPSTTTAAAIVGMGVQKYGRTTGHQEGSVDAINATVNVCYDARGPFCFKLATFVDQIVITPGTFSAGGDSGSGIVTLSGNNPVGLLFAGSDSHTIANPIDAALSAFSVMIDDGSGGGSTNDPPTASFTFSCTDLTCSFDGSGSSDSDGSITSYEWDFGDGNTSTQQNPSHTYASDGTYSVTLTVTDDDGATGSTSQDVTVSSSTASGTHVGDLDAVSSNNGRTWDAEVTITVHNADHSVASGVTVTGSFAGAGSGGDDGCTTDVNGQCTVTRTGIHKRNGSVTYSVTGDLDTTDNHDPDGDSNGTSITVNKP